MNRSDADSAGISVSVSGLLVVGSSEKELNTKQGKSAFNLWHVHFMFKFEYRYLER